MSLGLFERDAIDLELYRLIDGSACTGDPKTGIKIEFKRRKQMEQGTASNPITAREALEAWDAGQSVQAFQVEGSPDRQNRIYEAAFEMIRKWGSFHRADIQGHFELSDRELDVAHSIAHVAKESGWAKMVSQHIHRDSPAILVVKPKD